MTWHLAGALLVAAAMAARPPAQYNPFVGERHLSVAAAVSAALSTNPVVVAFGEFHQTNATRDTPSALRRFTEQILPVFADRFSHLVVETWVTTGRCGEAEKIVTAGVEKTTERPAQTETEIETVLRVAVARGVAPRILSVTCADYAAMRSSGESVDYDRALRVTERALEVASLAALASNRDGNYPRRTVPPGSAKHPAAVAVYGGALHNDVYPEAELAAYSFAQRLMAATLGRFVEVDLIVPEYFRRNSTLRLQPWWSTYLSTRRAGATVMIRRGPGSFVIVFPSR